MAVVTVFEKLAFGVYVIYAVDDPVGLPLKQGVGILQREQLDPRVNLNPWCDSGKLAFASCYFRYADVGQGSYSMPLWVYVCIR